MNQRISEYAALFTALVGLLISEPARAQSYPAHFVTFVVPSPPGGVTDIDARIIAKVLSVKIGRPVIVEPRPGAGGMIATEFVANAKPDGYTLLWASSGAIATSPWIYKKKLAYDPFKSFTPIHTLQEASPILLVSASSPFKSTADLVKYAKENPSKLNFGSAGNGTGQHIALELFKLAGGFEATHVPYRASTQAMTDLLAGVIDATFDYYSPAKSQLESGKLRALSVTASWRLPVLKDVPTLSELGYPVEWTGWSTVVAPAGTPPQIVDFLATAFAEALAAPEVISHLEATGTRVLPPKAKEGVEAFHRSESEKVRRLVQDSGISVE
ncbi:Bug family tripartite tricarboxylate transporter substrate binding protein [Bradyrhizobium sp. 23AC]